jgi:hypothetical protein
MSTCQAVFRGDAGIEAESVEEGSVEYDNAVDFLQSRSRRPFAR